MSITVFGTSALKETCVDLDQVSFDQRGRAELTLSLAPGQTLSLVGCASILPGDSEWQVRANVRSGGRLRIHTQFSSSAWSTRQTIRVTALSGGELEDRPPTLTVAFVTGHRRSAKELSLSIRSAMESMERATG